MLGLNPLSQLPISTLEDSGAGPTQSPFAQYNWPNPLVPTRVRLSYADNIELSLLTPVAEKPSGQQSFPAEPNKTVPRLGLTSTNLNLTLLGQQQAPFAQTNWPNPRKPALEYGFTGPSRNLTTLSIPFAQDQWPNPAISSLPPIAHTNSFELPLIGQDAMAPGKQLYPATIAPLPRARAFESPNLNETLLAALVTLPFNQYNWPNPAQPVYPQRHFDRLRINLSGLDNLPNGKASWPTTFGTAARDNRFEFTNLLQSVLQPLPIGSASLGRADPLPVRANGWTAPNLLETLLGGDTPFAQANWPVPRPRLSGQQATVPANMLALAASEIPFRPGQFDTPISAAYPAGLRTWTQNLLSSTLAPSTGQPFAFSAWTLPQGHQRPQEVTPSWFNINLYPPPIPPIILPDCGHLYSSIAQPGSLTEAFYTSGILTEAISKTGSTRSAASKTGSTRSTASHSGSLKPENPC